jgi:ankyrin repeat protein
LNFKKQENNSIFLIDDEYSSVFLIDYDAKLNQQTLVDKKTPLICLASLQSFNGMLNIAQKILANRTIDVNVQDLNGNTCLHCAIMSNNEIIFKEILKLSSPNMCLVNNKNETPLWLALLKAEENGM